MAVTYSSDTPPTCENNDGRHGSQDPWVIEEMPAGLIDDPLEFIFADHHRQREAASMLTMLADGECNIEGARALLAFLETDFALHIGDEELALFPMLREYCLPEDKVERILERLEEEHRKDETSLDQAVQIISKLISGEPVREYESSRLRQFAEHIRQHFALENGILLPIARVRLGKRERQILAEMLKKRRI